MKRIAALRTGKVFAALYTMVAAVTLPAVLIGMMASPKGAGAALPRVPRIS